MWERIKQFFRGSETIFWARLQAILGLMAAGLSAVDPAFVQELMTPRTFAVYMFINGLATEYLRRRRSDI